MLKINKLLFVGVIVLGFSCSSNKLTRRNVEYQEEDFYEWFINATKYALNGNYEMALKAYGSCVKAFPDRAAPYYQISNIFLTVNKVDIAKNYARKAVELDDSNKWYLLQLASIYQYESNLDSLIYTYEKVIKITDNPEYKYNLSVFYAQNGDHKNSMKLIKELENDVIDSKEVILLKHRNYAELHMSDSALFQLEYLVKLFPGEFENYGVLAEYLSELKKFNYAKKVYDELLEIEPDNGLANISYGDFYLQQNKKDTALLLYSKGFRADDIRLEDKLGILLKYLYNPAGVESDSVFIETLIEVLKDKYNDKRVYSVSAEYFIKRQKYDKAVVDLEQAILNGANTYIVWEQYVMINNYLGNHTDVDSIYSEALSNFPDEVRIHLYSAFSLFNLKKYDEVLNVCDSGLRIEVKTTDDQVQLLNLKADVLREKEMYDLSDSIYEVILTVDNENLMVRNNYSYYLSLRDKNLERAEELSRLTVKKEPKNSTFLDTYGWILFKLERNKEAIKYIESAIKNGAYNNSEVLDHYGELMRKVNRCSEAVEAWNIAIEYDSLNTDTYLNRIEEANKNCNED
jgi:tetratricopeptide (TPR) repeat protein